MGTTIRPELSEKNPYWIERHRYYELKHFCLQYPIWKKAYAALDGLSRRPSDLEVFSKKGEISATAHKVTDEGIMFIFDEYITRRPMNSKNTNKVLCCYGLKRVSMAGIRDG